MNDDKKNIKKNFFLHSCNINDNGVKVEREKEKSLEIKKSILYGKPQSHSSHFLSLPLTSKIQFFSISIILLLLLLIILSLFYCFLLFKLYFTVIVYFNVK